MPNLRLFRGIQRNQAAQELGNSEVAAIPPYVHRGSFASIATPGQLLPLPTQIVLKLSADQKTAVAELQKEVDGKVEALLTADQKGQLKQSRDAMARGSLRPGGPPRGPGGPPRFGGSPMGMTSGFGRAVFRAHRYATDYPGLAGKDLTPGKSVEDLERERAQAPHGDSGQRLESKPPDSTDADVGWRPVG